MIEIKDVNISKNPCSTNERIIISVEIENYLTYPYTYPYQYNKPKEN